MSETEASRMQWLYIENESLRNEVKFLKRQLEKARWRERAEQDADAN